MRAYGLKKGWSGANLRHLHTGTVDFKGRPSTRPFESNGPAFSSSSPLNTT